MADIRILSSITEIDPLFCHACYKGEVENYGYLLAVEKASIPGFAYGYLTAWEEETLLAIMPAFFTDYALDTTLQGAGKTIICRLKKAFPKLFTLKLACLGSPCTETIALRFHPAVSDKAGLLRQMLEAFEVHVRERGFKLIAMKDIPENDILLWQPFMQAKRYVEISAMPTAYLPIDFTSLEEYFARLSPATRKDMRRKLKKADAAVEIRYADSLEPVIGEVMALYHETRGRSAWQFEELTPAYFEGVLFHMKEASFATLYYVGGTLLAVNLVVHGDDTLIDKFFCMDGAAGREYNLYFLSWFTNIRYCLEHGYTRYQTGQAAYANKLRLGSTLIRNRMYFKHRGALTHRVLKFVSPLLNVHEFDIQEAA